jgi:hypothetical protein
MNGKKKEQSISALRISAHPLFSFSGDNTRSPKEDRPKGKGESGAIGRE